MESVWIIFQILACLSHGIFANLAVHGWRNHNGALENAQMENHHAFKDNLKIIRRSVNSENQVPGSNSNSGIITTAESNETNYTGNDPITTQNVIFESVISNGDKNDLTSNSPEVNETLSKANTISENVTPAMNIDEINDSGTNAESTSNSNNGNGQATDGTSGGDIFTHDITTVLTSAIATTVHTSEVLTTLPTSSFSSSVAQTDNTSEIFSVKQSTEFSPDFDIALNSSTTSSTPASTLSGTVERTTTISLTASDNLESHGNDTAFSTTSDQILNVSLSTDPNMFSQTSNSLSTEATPFESNVHMTNSTADPSQLTDTFVDNSTHVGVIETTPASIINDSQDISETAVKTTTAATDTNMSTDNQNTADGDNETATEPIPEPEYNTTAPPLHSTTTTPSDNNASDTIIPNADSISHNSSTEETTTVSPNQGNVKTTNSGDIVTGNQEPTNEITTLFTQSTTEPTHSSTQSTTVPIILIKQSTTELTTSNTQSTTEPITLITQSTTESTTSSTQSTTEPTTSSTQSTTEPTTSSTQSTTPSTHPTTESTTSSTQSATESTTLSTHSTTSSTHPTTESTTSSTQSTTESTTLSTHSTTVEPITSSTQSTTIEPTTSIAQSTIKETTIETNLATPIAEPSISTPSESTSNKPVTETTLTNENVTESVPEPEESHTTQASINTPRSDKTSTNQPNQEDGYSEPEGEKTPDPNSELEGEKSPDPNSEPEGEKTPDPNSEPEGEKTPVPNSEPEGEKTADPDSEGNGNAEPETDKESFAEPGPDWKLAKSVWKEAWEFHVYFFGLCFALLGLYCLFTLIRLWSMDHLLSKHYFITLHILVISVCILRAIYLLVDGYNSSAMFPRVVDYFLYSTAFPCITALFSILFYALLLATRLRVLSQKVQKLWVLLVIIVFHFVLSILTDVVAGLYTSASVMMFVCQVFFIAWGFLMFVGYLILFKKLYKGAISHQKTLTSNYNEHKNTVGNDYQSKPKKHKYTMGLAVKITFISAFFGVGITGFELYGIFGVYGSLNEDIRPEPWPWWTYHTVVRSLELLMCISVAYVASQPLKYRLRENFNGGIYKYCIPCSMCCCPGGLDQSGTFSSTNSLDFVVSDPDHLSWLKKMRNKRSPSPTAPYPPHTGEKYSDPDATLLVRKFKRSKPSMLVVEDGFVRIRTEDEIMPSNQYELDTYSRSSLSSEFNQVGANPEGDVADGLINWNYTGQENPGGLQSTLQGVNFERYVLQGIANLANTEHVDNAESTDDTDIDIEVTESEHESDNRDSPESGKSGNSANIFRPLSLIDLAASMESELERAFHSGCVEESDLISHNSLPASQDGNNLDTNDCVFSEHLYDKYGVHGHERRVTDLDATFNDSDSGDEQYKSSAAKLLHSPVRRCKSEGNKINSPKCKQFEKHKYFSVSSVDNLSKSEDQSIEFPNIPTSEMVTEL